MKVESRDGSRERRILIGMIVDPTVLASIAAKWDGEMFSGTWSNVIGGWCADYWNRYGKAPRRNIETIFEAWSHETKDQATVDIINRFLGELSGEYKRLREELVPKQILDISGDLFNRVKLSRLRDEIEGFLDSGQADLAFKAVQKFGRVELGTGSSSDLLQDRDGVRRVFTRTSEPPLVTYPGALGQFFGRFLERDGFVAFMGREKIGKTWWLMDVAWRGLLERKRVAFFEVGDLSEEQIRGRFLTRAARAPLVSLAWPCTVKVPLSIGWHSSKDADEDKPRSRELKVEYEERTFATPLLEEEGWNAFKRVQAQRVRSDHSFFKLSVHSNRSLSVAGLRSCLEQWDRVEEWRPDIICVDYADILAPPAGFFGDSRDAINENWMQLRALSQDTHSLVLTATQANREAYKGGVLDMNNVAEDKRKFAHVTAMVGLNSDEDEVEQQVYRLNVLVGREFQYAVKRCVHTVGCLGLASPAMKSTW